MKQCKKCIVWLLKLWVLASFAGLVIIPAFHKTAKQETRSVEAEGEGPEDQSTEGRGIEDQSVKTGSEEAPERVLSIDDNVDALQWRLRLIGLAQKRLVLATFDFREDNSGRDMMAALLQAADRGVHVQLLVDGINGCLWLNHSADFAQLAEHENVEVKFYNPINLLKPWKLNYRMHDKYLIADDCAYLLGGRNTDDLFLGNYVETYNEDRDVLIYETQPGKGTSYRQLQEYFESVWALSCCKPYKPHGWRKGTLREHEPEIEAFHPEAGENYGKTERAYPESWSGPEWLEISYAANSIELYSNPIEDRNKAPRLWQQMVCEMQKEKDILIQTPYVICSKQMYQDLTTLSASGAQIEMVINAVENGSNPFGCTDYLNQKGNVLKTGITVCEYLGNQAMHTKAVLAGKNICLIGSCNTDMRSVYLDTELMLKIDCPELNQCIRAQVEEMKKESRMVSLDKPVVEGESYTAREQSVSRKIFYRALRVLILPIRHLL